MESVRPELRTAEDILEAGKVLRMALDGGLQSNESGHRDATGSCLYASLLVLITLNRFAMASAVVRGGDGDLHQGAADVHGVWRGHYWVEATTFEGVGFVIDITADQFGYPEVQVLRLEESRQRYRCGDQAGVDEAVLELAAELGVDRHLLKPVAVGC